MIHLTVTGLRATVLYLTASFVHLMMLYRLQLSITDDRAL
jgi:hypothetical protein